MADVTWDEVVQHMTDLNTSATAMRDGLTMVAQHEQAQRDEIAALQAQLAAGSPVTPAQLTALDAQIAATQVVTQDALTQEATL